jgi:uncharacterized phage-like protein YoqJ
MVIAGTGHRPNKLNFEWNAEGPLSDAIFNQLVEILTFYKPTKIISGLALGFDTILAKVALHLEIPLIAAIPCDNQDALWSEKAKQTYKKILSHPLVTKYIVSPGPYAPWKMTKRNQWMVDQIKEPEDVLLSCHDGSKGGTKNCIDYATIKGVKIININPIILKALII